jgi:hypothetical protein
MRCYEFLRCFFGAILDIVCQVKDQLVTPDHPISSTPLYFISLFRKSLVSPYYQFLSSQGGVGGRPVLGCPYSTAKASSQTLPRTDSKNTLYLVVSFS